MTVDMFFTGLLFVGFLGCFILGGAAVIAEAIQAKQVITIRLAAPLSIEMSGMSYS